jgi:CBS domain-containing protein
MGLYENMLKEPVSQLNLREPVFATPDETVRDAVLRMRERQLGCVYVVDEQGRAIGMFAENMLNRLLVTNPSGLDDPLRRHMSDYWCCAQLTDPIVKIVTAMQSRNVRFVCVQNTEARVVGLAGQKGLMEYVADHFPGQVMVQRIGCAPYSVRREGA